MTIAPTDVVTQVEEMLAQYYAAYQAVASATADKRRQLEALQADINNIEQAVLLKHGFDSLNDMRVAVSDLCVSHGASIRCPTAPLQVIYRKPDVSWDTSGLEGLAIILPKLLELRRTGKASAYIKLDKP